MTAEESLEVLALCAARTVFHKFGGWSEADERISELTGLKTPSIRQEEWQRRYVDSQARKSDLRTADLAGRAA